jgi:hypothetical protein
VCKGGVWGPRKGGSLRQIKSPAAKSLCRTIFLHKDI